MDKQTQSPEYQNMQAGMEGMNYAGKSLKGQIGGEREGVRGDIDASSVQRGQFAMKNNRIFAKLTVLLGVLLAVSIVCSVIFVVKKNQEIAELRSTVTSQQEQIGLYKTNISQLKKRNNLLNSENEELKNGKDKMLVDVRNAFDSGDWEKTIEAADALHEKYNGSEQDKTGQEIRKTAQKKIDEAAAAKKRKEEEAARKKAEEEARGYETGITYDQLARTPDQYVGKKVKFSGKVIQIQNSIVSDDVTIRLAVDGNSNRVIYGTFQQNLTKTRILEDDYITIYGTSEGDVTYTTVMGNAITIPDISIEKIDQ